MGLGATDGVGVGSGARATAAGQPGSVEEVGVVGRQLAMKSEKMLSVGLYRKSFSPGS